MLLDADEGLAVVDARLANGATGSVDRAARWGIRLCTGEDVPVAA